MKRNTPWVLIALGLFVGVGCKGDGMLSPTAGDIPPALLIGPDAAAAQTQPPAELPPDKSAQLCVETARQYEKNNQVEDAIRLYEKARSNDPASAAEAGRRLAVLYDKAGEFSKSDIEYENLLLATPFDADLLNDYGYSLYSRGNWSGAEEILRRAVEANPGHKRAWINLGMAQAQQQRWDESFQSFSQGVRPADAHCNLGFMYATQGRLEEAKHQYHQAMLIDPSSKLARVALLKLNPPEFPENDSSVRPADYDPVEAAAQVPTVQEIEAKMRIEKAGTPVLVDPSNGTSKQPKPAGVLPRPRVVKEP